jgi:hypothetical protein
LLRFSDKQWLPEDEASVTIGFDFQVRSLTTKLEVHTFMHSRTEGQDEYMGAPLCFLPLV